MSEKRIQQIIRQFNMQPHPEGGYFSEEYRSDSELVSPVNQLARAAVTHIYFLLTQGQVSRWHKVLHDEIWNVYEGDPLRILTLSGKSITSRVIGELNTKHRSDFFEVIRGGDYQAAETTGQYTFLGCTVAPGFEFKDFSYIEDNKTKELVINLGEDYARFL
uniref:cupin domain-containing protein n=1 Tax=Ningiella ruwaisensis TaxID=2364274 RepID=UPI001F4FC4B5|nr:cupin domain-containing protein [Ningiella ruwaisensis]